MQIDQTIFRRYDVRGKYPAELSDDAAYNIALAFANLYPEIKTVAVGGDMRKSTPALKEAVKKGLIDGGKEVIDFGIVITPIIYFGVCHYSYDAGIVITGSHLEGIYNGIKIVLKNSTPTGPSDYENILKHILEDKLKKAEIAGSEKNLEIVDDYCNYIKEKINIKKPLKVIIDTGNGITGLLPEKLFKTFGCEVETIYAEPDDTFPNHFPDPYKTENMMDLKKRVIETGADLGIAFDGDGDRASFIDKSGYVLNGDDLLMIFSRDALSKKKGPIAVDSRASMALIEEVKKQEQKIFLTVGYHAAVLAKVIEMGAVFGGETTCHFYFPLEIYLTDDAIFAALKIAMIASEQKDFVEFVKKLPRYFASQEIFIEFPDETKYQTVDRLVRIAKQRKLSVNDVDGARINYDNGWGIVRAANTSPYVKVRFEGKTEKDMHEIAQKIMALMEEVSIIMPEKDKESLGL